MMSEDKISAEGSDLRYANENRNIFRVKSSSLAALCRAGSCPYLWMRANGAKLMVCPLGETLCGGVRNSDWDMAKTKLDRLFGEAGRKAKEAAALKKASPKITVKEFLAKLDERLKIDETAKSADKEAARLCQARRKAGGASAEGREKEKSLRRTRQAEK